MGKKEYGTMGRVYSAKSLFANAALNPNPKTFDLNLLEKLNRGKSKFSSKLDESKGNLGENRSFEDLRVFYGMHVSPKAHVRADRHLGQQLLMDMDQSDQSLIFHTTHAKLRVDDTPIEREVHPKPQRSSCEIYTLRSPKDTQVVLGIIRLSRTWRNSQAKVLDLDFIVIRATTSGGFEPWWHNSKVPTRSAAPPDGRFP